jgi:hypothetical protein
MNDQHRTVEQFERENPLWRFSPYLFGRINVLMGIRIEILECLDRTFGESVDFTQLERAEELAWLWTLGAYEVVRTMCQAKSCFSLRAENALRDLKRTIGKVRIPAAKMEVPGKRTPVTSARSPAGVDAKNKDILLGAPGQELSCREILASFYGVLSAIAPEDVVLPHEASYQHAS